MVRVSQVLALTGLCNGAIASFFNHKDCDRLKIKLTPFDEPNCAGVDSHKTRELKQGHCYNFHDFQSAAINIVDKHGPGLSHRNCSVWFFDHDNCKGQTMTSGDFRHLKAISKKGVCGNVINHNVHGGGKFAQAHSARWYCIPDNWQEGMEPTHTCGFDSTHSISPSPIHTSFIKPSHSRTPITATIKQTTTVLFPPVATVSGTTTVWVSPKSRKMRTETLTHTTTFLEDNRESSSPTASVESTQGTRHSKRKNEVEERKKHYSKALKKDGAKPSAKNRGPAGECYGWSDDDITVTDCGEVVPPPSKASPHLDAWDGQA